MNIENKIQSRKKFIGLGISTAALLAAFKLLKPGKDKNSTKVKMLTQDGKLVEVDVERINKEKKNKVTDEQLKSWVIKRKL
ncbi:MAG: hypothetical protein ACXWCR_11220 [Flavitalea sp.]